MAVLPDADRRAVWAETMRKLSADHETITITKADLRAAVDALDDYMNNNQTAINNVIPPPARQSLTTQQKALMLMYVIQRRYLAGV